MKRFHQRFLLSLYAVFALFSVTAQGQPQEYQELNRAIFRYYPNDALVQFQQFDPVQLDIIRYYFNQSYSVQFSGCSECSVDYDQLLNLDLFNVADFEELRQETESTTFQYKKTPFIITLLPKQEVEQNLNGHTIVDMTTILPVKPLPIWANTGDNAADYNLYKQELDTWIHSFPEKYRELTNGSELIKMPISEFLLLPQDKKDELSSSTNKYLLID